MEVPVQGGDELGTQPAILLAKTFRKLQIHTSVLSGVTERRTELEYNVASVYPIKRQWFPTFEFNGRRENVKSQFYPAPGWLPASQLDVRREHVKNWFYLTPGLYRHLKHRLEMGIGIPVGAGGVAGSVGIVAKMNWEYGGDQ